MGQVKKAFCVQQYTFSNNDRKSPEVLSFYSSAMFVTQLVTVRKREPLAENVKLRESSIWKVDNKIGVTNLCFLFCFYLSKQMETNGDCHGVDNAGFDNADLAMEEIHGENLGQSPEAENTSKDWMLRIQNEKIVSKDWMSK